ncbi:MAG TPA: DUF6502 family protein [Acidiphilium sp.]|jgi:hypothetical protein|nr:MAG: hypothetical protein B7Z67_09780 [Acidiphilium sp. 21-60-14]OYV89785.1 MAG: hypothetical protein B7Z57_11290 [Acidiphilium sp. 37-60-79]OZB39787.1 MAG: hypothetical protein B7X48_07545 [Acidiphilium sp. 34-60-192]HQT89498.1 DUF6502 family protein [Acidiphilium sp.]HQU24808.1 DUF6502 family protein [Acidiphilium sp.]
MESDLESMLRRILRPLIAYLMRRGIGYIAVRDLIKRVFIDEALRGHIAEPPPTDSQISLVTGINRREVKRLREETGQAAPAERDPMAGINMAARVVATWVSAPAFRDQSGEPRRLAVHGDSVAPRFDDLLRTAKIDVRARTVIEELLRAGVVVYEPDDQLRLVRSSFTPAASREKMLFLASNVGDHLRSALHNLGGPSTPFIERALFHNAIRTDRLDAARPILTDMADRLLRQANERLLDGNLAHTDAETPADHGNMRRLRLGVYYYETDSEDRP